MGRVSRRRCWVGWFLAATVLVVGAELWASFDGDPDTVPWTELVVTHVPGEAAAAAIGALLVWLPLHFGLRYGRKRRRRNVRSSSGEVGGDEQ